MTRQQRRQEERRLRKAKTTGTSQVFSFTDEAGDTKQLDVERMRKWAEEYSPLLEIDVDIKRATEMLEQGRVDLKYIEKKASKMKPKPILVCIDFLDGADEIVDGNHLYVTAAIASVGAEEMGIPIPRPPRMNAYFVRREDWQQFVL